MMVLACHLVARIGSSLVSNWAFIPVILTLWLIALTFLRPLQNDTYKKWFGKSKGNAIWKGLVILVGILPLPVFLLHWRTLSSWQIILPYVIIALVNPFVEEMYWRGLLLDHLSKWKNWHAVLYTSLFFALNHPLSFGMFSKLNSGLTVFISTFIMGIVWGFGYKKIGNLRLIIFSHFLVDTFNLSVPAFLDLYESKW